jgi:cytochrome oxidase assembly protein ShyY1
MWHLIRRPRWIVLFVLAAGLGSLFIRLGFRQWHKHHARDAQNTATLAGQNAAPVPIQTLLPATSGTFGSAAYRRVTLTGTYDAAHDLIVYGRVRNADPGNEVITPLVLPDGRTVIVNRGWIPFQGGKPDLAQSSPPTGTVHLTGVLEPTETTGTSLPTPPLTQVTFIDLSELSTWLGHPVLPYWVHLESQRPPQAEYPKTVELPPLDGGPYFSYALQWWFFASVAFFGYPFLLYREVRDQRKDPRRDASEPSAGSRSGMGTPPSSFEEGTTEGP